MSRLCASRQTRRAGGKTMPRFPRHHPSVQQRGRTSNRRISSGAPKTLLNQRFRSGPHPCDSSARAPSQGRLAGAAPLAIMQSATPARMGIWSWRRNQEPNSTRRHFSPRRMAESPSPSTGRVKSSSPRATPRIPSSTFEKAGSKSRLSPIKVRKRSSRSSKPEISSARVV
jgi:hypothetical protein